MSVVQVIEEDLPAGAVGDPIDAKLHPLWVDAAPPFEAWLPKAT